MTNPKSLKESSDSFVSVKKHTSKTFIKPIPSYQKGISTKKNDIERGKYCYSVLKIKMLLPNRFRHKFNVYFIINLLFSV